MDTFLRFLGATDTVTGSRYLLETPAGRILVDCGLFQGYKTLRERNWKPFAVDPASIDAVLITHAHLDHTGYLPALVRDGFRGTIHATHGTTDLSRLILPDSGRLLEEQASFATRHHTSKHETPRPLYTEQDALTALERFRSHRFDDQVPLGNGVSARFVPAGHILGAAQVHVDAQGARVHLTGDLGRQDDPLMQPPRALEETDVLVTESTYGNRTHPLEDPSTPLGEIITRVCSRGGVVLLPAFAVGRAESLLLHLSRLRRRGEIPDVPVYLNSPMAVNASDIYGRYPQEQRISSHEFKAMYSLATLVRTVDESKLLNLRGGPAVIISASGMLEGGRILHHIVAYGSDPRNAIVLTGFQAGGTRGAALQRGERTLRIYGRDVSIRAEVLTLQTLSAHADASQILDWLRASPTPPKVTFVTHGEPDASDALRRRIQNTLGWTAHVPDLGETVNVTEIARS
ncbi:MBL fold metallo-hydrolase RNA specificity domain-containing protein [Leifsonia poae]|uniref:MBL fold hydrolase n=1 Tax=Leifsonia poae TaxID=110933 RepID=A0A9W6HAN0_9MICO|nr:MBL fold metallo-hydrolase [Leifsonia poae]GLJ76524.1 MBL fold hydrolase [Leifsonia poae]